MKYKLLLCLSIAVMFLGGCGVLDSIFLPKTNADGSVSPSTAASLGSILGFLGPIGGTIGTIAGAFGTVYTAVRGKKYKDAVVYTVTAAGAMFDQIDTDKDGKISKEELAAYFKGHPEVAKLAPTT